MPPDTGEVLNEGAELEGLGITGNILRFFSLILVVLFFPFSLISSVKVSPHLPPIVPPHTYFGCRL